MSMLSQLCRIRYLPQLASHRRKHLVYSGLVLEIQDDGRPDGAGLVMLSLAEAFIYLETHPRAHLRIREEIDLLPQEGKRYPKRSSVTLTLSSGGNGYPRVSYYMVSPNNELAPPGIAADYSRLPHKDLGGRWPVKTVDIARPVS